MSSSLSSRHILSSIFLSITCFRSIPTQDVTGPFRLPFFVICRAFLSSWTLTLLHFSHSPSNRYSLSLYFRKNITCLSVALLRVGQVFSLFRKTVCRWVKIDCCFMSDICNRAYSQFWFAPDSLEHNCPVNRGVCIQARKNKQLSIQRTIQHSTTRWQHEGRLNYTWFVLRIKLPPLNDAVEQSVDIMADLLMTARRWWWW